MEYINYLQWPAMVATITAAWLIGSQSKRKRKFGFRFFLLSNALWITWAFHDNAYALIILQFALAALNIRGVRKNEPATATNEPATAAP